MNLSIKKYIVQICEGNELSLSNQYMGNYNEGIRLHTIRCPTFNFPPNGSSYTVGLMLFAQRQSTRKVGVSSRSCSYMPPPPKEQIYFLIAEFHARMQWHRSIYCYITYLLLPIIILLMLNIIIYTRHQQNNFVSHREINANVIISTCI